MIEQHSGTKNTEDIAWSLEESILYQTVVKNGYCIGCGACAAVTDSPVNIQLNEKGCFEATWTRASNDKAIEKKISSVCPFSNDAENEDEIGKALYAKTGTYDKRIGYHMATYVGYVEEENYRALGSSGGMGKWILAEILRKGMVDTVIQVHANEPDEKDPMVYMYSVAKTVEDVKQGSKSVYYPVNMVEVMEYIRENPGRYAVTGIPCFIKAIRLLCKKEPILAERIEYCIGLICGHMKSTKYAEMIAWQFGVQPGELSYIDFRKKLPGARANHKGIEVKSLNGSSEVKEPDIVQNLFGTDYNHGFFQYNACDFCDDVVGETADISVGDAWLPEYMADGGGNSVVVVRNPAIHAIVQDAMAQNRLALEDLGAERTAKSQAGGFRQRREGLAYRLHLTDKKGTWRPQKRVKPQKNHIGKKRREIYRLRTLMSKKSHTAFQEALKGNNFSLFKKEMEVLLAQYKELYKPTFVHRIRRGIQRRIQWISRKIFKG